jgi:hypothetical protein
MNVSEQIINVLDNLCQKFGIAIDWSAQNVLPYLQELCGRFINYEIWTSIAWMIFMLTICVICWVVFGSSFKGAKKEEWDPDYLVCWVNVLSGVCAVGFSVLSIIVIGCQAFDIVEAICLPEKTIYDFITYQMSLHN